jgi:Holliday junction DNA helicase RuvA
MYSYLTGKLTDIHPTQAVVETNGIGYEIEISLYTYEQIKPLQTVKLYTQLIVREDGHYLFGFFKKVDKEVFVKLISVSGIGPNTARLILSGMRAEEVVQAVQTENDIAFKKVKGVGPKTAKRIILDLKDKLTSIQVEGASESSSLISKQNNTVYDEALSALVTLGFKKAQVLRALSKIKADRNESDNLETVVKKTLQLLTGG